MPDAEKRAQADFVIDTGLGIEAARRPSRRSSPICAGKPGSRRPDACRPAAVTMLRRRGLIRCAKSSSIRKRPASTSREDRIIEIGGIELDQPLSDRPHLPRLHQSAGPRRSIPTRWPCTASAPRDLAGQADLRRDRRRIPRLHRRRAAGRPQCRASTSASSMPNSPARPAGGRSGDASSTRWRWRAASIRWGRIRSMRCAAATASTTATAPSTARCSIPNCWPKSISS